jgi:hypothetical protein
MAGGLFHRPFVFNEKCIIFSLICMALFLTTPPKNVYLLIPILFFIFVIAYVAMAWYDYYFNCDLIALKRGQMSVTSLFKPSIKDQQLSKKSKQTFADNTEKQNVETRRKKLLIYAFHLVGIVPLLIYICYFQKSVHSNVYILLGVLTLFTFLYHGSEMMVHA